MMEVIAVRVALFLVAFFVLRRALTVVWPGRSLRRSLLLLGVTTLVAFAGSAVIFDESLPRTLIGWAVIYGLIAGLWFIRARSQEFEAMLLAGEAKRRSREAGTGPGSPGQC